MDWTGPVAMTSVVRQADGTMDEAYLERAHARLVHGFIDTCTRDFDQTWLDYQHEVGLRHHRAKKNQADGAHGVVPHIPYRWIVAFLYPFTQAIRPLLEKAEASPEEREAMLQAWTKAFTLQVTLYSRAYVPQDDW
jgi:hypothetical protein